MKIFRNHCPIDTCHLPLDKFYDGKLSGGSCPGGCLREKCPVGQEGSSCSAIAGEVIVEGETIQG